MIRHAFSRYAEAAKKNFADMAPKNKQEEKISDPSQRLAGQSASFFGNSSVAATTHRSETGENAESTQYQCVVS